MLLTMLAFLSSAMPGAVAGAEPPIRLWLTADSGAMYFRRGDQVRVLFRTTDDAHVVILRSAANGDISVLFPTDPEDMNLVRGGTTYEVLGRGQPRSFVVDEDNGAGFVLAVRTDRPIPVGRFARRDSAGGWDYRALDAARAGRRGKEALVEIARALALDSPMDYDVTNYIVSNDVAPPVAMGNPAQPALPSVDSRDYPASAPQTMAQAPNLAPPLLWQPAYDPQVYGYPVYTDPYAYLYGSGSRRRHRPSGSPASTSGPGAIVGHGDPSSYVAVPWGPRPQVPRTLPATAVASLVVVQPRPAAVAASTLRSARPMSAAENRSMAKISFGPVAPLRVRHDPQAPSSNSAVAIAGSTRESVRPVSALAPTLVAATALTYAARPQVASTEPLGMRPAIGNGSRGGFNAGGESVRQPVTQAAGRPSAGTAVVAPRPAIAGQAYIGPSSPVVPRVIPRQPGH